MIEWSFFNDAGTAASATDYELYDYQEDPLESQNIADSNPTVLAELKATLRTHPPAMQRAQ